MGKDGKRQIDYVVESLNQSCIPYLIGSMNGLVPLKINMVYFYIDL
jgi:hypothetical protein